MQADVWQRFLISNLWELFRPPRLSWTPADLPICKYKISVIFILPFRLMVRMLQVTAEPGDLCKPGIPSCLRVAETPEVCPSQSHGCILQLLLCAGRAGSEAAAPVCVRAQPSGCPYHTQSVQITQPCCSSPLVRTGVPYRNPTSSVSGSQAQPHSRTAKHRRGLQVRLTPLPRPGRSFPGCGSPLLDANVAQSLLTRFTCTPTELNSGAHGPAVPSRLLPLTPCGIRTQRRNPPRGRDGRGGGPG